MKLRANILSLGGLRAQVLLWIVLPLTILLIIFALSSVNSHQASMQTLAMDENIRLVTALSRLMTSEAENYALRHQIPVNQVQASDLDLDSLLAVEHPYLRGSVLLLDQDGTVLFRRGDLENAEEISTWPGVPELLLGESGVVFTLDLSHSDVVAYTPIRNTSWSLIIREAWHSPSDPLIRFEQLMPFILFTATATSLLTLFFGLRYVVKPLRELGSQASKIGQGEFETLAKPVGGVKEIEDLRIALHDMSQRVQNYQAALHDYLGAVTQAQEEERARLGRELHDQTVQALIALGHKAQSLQRNYDRSSPQTSQQIIELREMIAHEIDGVRRFSRGLHPHYLEELGLVTALETIASEGAAEFSILGSITSLKEEKELALYRVAQEAVNNARHHANAKRILLELAFDSTHVTLQVKDDGIGFDFPSQFNDLTRTGHFGLIGMRERAQLIDGQITINSSPGNGTIVIFKVPISA